MRKALFILAIFIPLTINLFGNNLLVKEKDLKFIYSLFNDNKFDVASTQIDQFINQYPTAQELNEIRHMKIECLFMLGQYEPLIKTAQNYLNQYSGYPYAAQLMYRQIIAYFYLGSLDPAIIKFLDFQKKFPGHELNQELYYWLGMVYYQKNNTREAEEYLNKYLTQPVSGYEDYARYTLGRIYNTRQNYDQARAVISGINANSQSPLYLQTQQLLIEILYGQEKYEAALKQMNSLPAATLNDNDYLMLIGALCELGLKRYDSALAQAQSLLKKFPHTTYQSQVYATILQLYYQKRNYSSAMELGKKLESFTHVHGAEYFYWYGMNQIAGMDLPSAEQSLKKLITYNPDLGEELRYTLADAYYTNKNYNKVITLLEPYNFSQERLKLPAKKRLADSYFQLKNYQKALSIYESYRSLGKDQQTRHEATFLAGLCAFELGNPRQALDYMKQVVIDGSGGSDHYELAIIYALRAFTKLNDEKGFRQFLPTVKTLPKNKTNLFQYYYYQGYLWFTGRQYNQAVNNLNQALSQASTDTQKATIEQLLGDCFFNLKEFDNATAYYEKALLHAGTQQNKSQVNYQLGLAYLRLKEYQSAAQQFQKIFNSGIRSEWEDDAFFYYGRTLFLQEQYPQAIEHLKNYSTRYPQSPFLTQVNFILGDANYNLNNHEQAINWYQKNLDKSQTAIVIEQSLKSLEWTLMQFSDQGQALEYVDQWLKIEAMKVWATQLTLIKIHLLEKQKQIPRVVELYDSLLAQPKSDISSILPDYINFLVISQQEKEARLILDKYLARLPEGEQRRALNLKMAELLFKQKNYEDALQQLRLVSAPEEESFPLWLLEAKIQSALNRQDSSEQLLKKIIAIGGDNYYAREAGFELGKLYFANSQFNEAGQIFQEIIAVSSNELAAGAQYYMGEIKFARQDYPMAASDYLKVQYLYEKFTDWVEKSRYKEALCDLQLNHSVQAREKLKKLAETAADSSIRKLAGEELKKIE